MCYITVEQVLLESKLFLCNRSPYLRLLGRTLLIQCLFFLHPLLDFLGEIQEDRFNIGTAVESGRKVSAMQLPESFLRIDASLGAFYGVVLEFFEGLRIWDLPIRTLRD